MRMVAEARAQQLPQPGALLPHPTEQLLLDQGLLHRQAGRAGDRMGHIGVAVLEEARARADRLADRAREASVAPIGW